MANRKSVEQQIAEAQEKIKQEQNSLKKLQKKQTEQNNKARNHRLCKRHGLLESILPDTIELTDKQFEDFVRHHIANSHGRNKLAEMVAQGAEDTTPKNEETTGQPASPATPKTANAGQNQKPTAPAEAKNSSGNPQKGNANNAERNNGNPQKHNVSNAGTNPPT